MAREFSEAVSQWRKLRTLCGTMEQLAKRHRTAYAKRDGKTVKPNAQTQTEIEAEIDAMGPEITEAYNAMKAALAP